MKGERFGRSKRSELRVPRSNGGHEVVMDGHGVDFSVPQQSRSPWLIQACESLIDPKTRNREIASLSEAMAEMGVAAGTIVTRTEEDEIKTESGIVKVVPVWRFLLDMPEP